MPGRTPIPSKHERAMSRRFFLVGVVLAALIGGLAYFQFVFKPQMIRGFLSKMVPPPATVTTAKAKREKTIAHRSEVGRAAEL